MDAKTSDPNQQKWMHPGSNRGPFTIIEEPMQSENHTTRPYTQLILAQHFSVTNIPQPQPTLEKRKREKQQDHINQLFTQPRQDLTTSNN